MMMRKLRMETPPNCHECGKPLRKIKEAMDNTREWEWNEKTQKYTLADEWFDDSDLLCEECGANLSIEEREFFFDNYKTPKEQNLTA